jgi:hypothetical protein
MYPEHDKLNMAELDVLDTFYEYLESQGLEIVGLSEVSYYKGNMKCPKWHDLRVQYFGTTQKNLEAERLHMLKAMSNTKS